MRGAGEFVWVAVDTVAVAQAVPSRGGGASCGELARVPMVPDDQAVPA